MLCKTRHHKYQEKTYMRAQTLDKISHPIITFCFDPKPTSSTPAAASQHHPSGTQQQPLQPCSGGRRQGA